MVMESNSLRSLINLLLLSGGRMAKLHGNKVLKCFISPIKTPNCVTVTEHTVKSKIRCLSTLLNEIQPSENGIFHFSNVLFC